MLGPVSFVVREHRNRSRWLLVLCIVVLFLSPVRTVAYHGEGDGALATLSVTPSLSCDRRILVAKANEFSDHAGSSPVTLRLDSRSATPFAQVSPPSKKFSVAFLMPPGAAAGYHTIIGTQTTSAGNPVPGTPARTSIQVTESPTPCEGLPPEADEEDVKPWIRIYQDDPACGTPLFHYTGSEGLSGILASSSIFVTPKYTGRDGFTHPAGAYTTDIPPLPPTTRTQLQDLYRLGDRTWDVSRFVLLCSRLNTMFFPNGYQSEWYAPPIGDDIAVPVRISLVGVNLMAP